ncbi:hypothetical protein [Nocardia australiensis]|uniref:hypothetical protein n=1 Tax=Nocardia australiensis TaxID=2887191 RepID=UPI001D133C07|nr:hypothetical protein [Nocardia australiensis]
MFKIKKAVVLCSGAVGIAALATVIAPATASAATYGGQCGAGHHVIDSHALSSGTIFLTYDGSTNCVVTVRNQPGNPVHMTAGLRKAGDGEHTAFDEGNFREYAGPVKLSAKGQCIDWGGMIGNDVWNGYKTHCG